MQMIDRHALLQRVYEHPYERNGMTDAEWCRKCIYEAPTIEAEPVRHGRWIPCSERMPEKGFVLAHDAGTGAFYIARWSDEYDCWYDEFCYVLNFSITHWMPVPEPPESEAKDERL